MTGAGSSAPQAQQSQTLSAFTARKQQEAQEIDLTRPLQWYLQRCPSTAVLTALKEAGEACNVAFTSYTFQAAFLRQVLLHPVAVTYPPGHTFTRTVLERYLAAIESDGDGDVHDALMEQMVQVLHRTEDVCYESFCVPGGGFITCRTSPRDNEVGLRCWEAGLLLAEFCASNPPCLRGRRVVELGAGIGMTGLVCAAAAAAATAAAAVGGGRRLRDGARLGGGSDAASCRSRDSSDGGSSSDGSGSNDDCSSSDDCGGSGSGGSSGASMYCCSSGGGGGDAHGGSGGDDGCGGGSGSDDISAGAGGRCSNDNSQRSSGSSRSRSAALCSGHAICCSNASAGRSGSARAGGHCGSCGGSGGGTGSGGGGTSCGGGGGSSGSSNSGSGGDSSSGSGGRGSGDDGASSGSSGGGGPREVILTDGQPRVVTNLRHNVELNAAALRCPVTVARLSWEDPDLDALGDDVGAVIGADLVYDIAAVPALVALIAALRTRWPRARVLLASTLRDPTTFAAFDAALRATAGAGAVRDVTAAVVAAAGAPSYWSPNRGAVRVTEVAARGD